MGQFKPMVKMRTTEPSVELKLKKGGKVERKMQMGGLMDMPAQMPAQMPPEVPPPAMPATGGMMPARAPRKPSLAARRRAMRAMPAGAPPPAPVGMAARMAEAAAPMKKGGKVSKLEEHAAKPASKAHKGLKTGGVVMGQAGYKEGGHAKKTGGVVSGKPGGYATGGVAMSNAGGYKKGGAAKKAYAAGGSVDSGAPVAMPQGRKKPTPPVAINELAGTFKKGGKVDLQKVFKKENAPAMKAAKAYSNEVYSKYGKKMANGGSINPMDAPQQIQGRMTEAERRMLRGEEMEDIPADIKDQMQTMMNQKAFEEYERSRGLTGQGRMTEEQRGAIRGRGIPGALTGQGQMTEGERDAMRGRGAPGALSGQGRMTEQERDAMRGRGAPKQGQMTERERKLLRTKDLLKKSGGKVGC